MSATPACAMCRIPLTGARLAWEYKGRTFALCPLCAELPLAERMAALRPALRELDRAEERAQAAARAAGGPRYRTDIPEERLEEILLHAFLDLIQERKLAGKAGLAATMPNIAAWLSERTGLQVRAAHVKALTLALRDGGLIAVGGGGIGRPNFYDTRESEMGLDPFWDQVEAFLAVYRLPGRRALLELPGGQAAR